MENSMNEVTNSSAMNQLGLVRKLGVRKTCSWSFEMGG